MISRLAPHSQNHNACPAHTIKPVKSGHTAQHFAAFSRSTDTDNNSAALECGHSEQPCPLGASQPALTSSCSLTSELQATRIGIQRDLVHSSSSTSAWSCQPSPPSSRLAWQVAARQVALRTTLQTHAHSHHLQARAHNSTTRDAQQSCRVPVHQGPGTDVKA